MLKITFLANPGAPRLQELLHLDRLLAKLAFMRQLCVISRLVIEKDACFSALYYEPNEYSIS